MDCLVVSLVNKRRILKGEYMERYFYELSENGWEYTGNIEVQCKDKPVCTNNSDEHYLIADGVKIIFDEEIREA